MYEVLVNCLNYCTLDQRHEFTPCYRSVLRFPQCQWSCNQHLSVWFRLRNHWPSDIKTYPFVAVLLVREVAGLKYSGRQNVLMPATNCIKLQIVTSADTWLSNK